MIQLLRCGYRYTHPTGITLRRPHGSGDYAFVLFRSRSEVVASGKRMVAERDSYILFQPSTPHLYRDLELPYINDWFHCQGEDMAEWLADLRFPLDEPVPAADPLLISRSIMELHRMQKMGGPLADRAIDAELRALLIKLCNLRRMPQLADKPGRYYRALTDIRNELYNAPHQRTTVDDLAARANLSKSYFQHLYKDMFGCSVVDDRIHGRLEYAKYLLQNSALSISAIAETCGYEHDTHFMRQFKKFAGVTPGQYRASR